MNKYVIYCDGLTYCTEDAKKAWKMFVHSTKKANPSDAKLDTLQEGNNMTNKENLTIATIKFHLSVIMFQQESTINNLNIVYECINNLIETFKNAIEYDNICALHWEFEISDEMQVQCYDVPLDFLRWFRATYKNSLPIVLRNWGI